MQSATITFFMVFCKVALGQPHPGVWQIPSARFNGEPLSKTLATVRLQLNTATDEYRKKDESTNDLVSRLKHAEIERHQTLEIHERVLAEIKQQNASLAQEIDKLRREKSDMEEQLKNEANAIQTELNAVIEVKKNQEEHIKQAAAEKQALLMQTEELKGKLGDISSEVHDMDMMTQNNIKLGDAIRKQRDELKQQQDTQAHTVADIKSTWEKVSKMRESMVTMRDERIALEKKNKELAQTVTEVSQETERIKNSLQKLRG